MTEKKDVKDIEEKRIKPAVIRRRAAEVPPEKEKVSALKAEAQKEKGKEGKPAKKETKPIKGKAAPLKERAKKAKKELIPEKEKAAAPPSAPLTPALVIPPKKEVTVFKKESERGKKPSTPRQVYRKGKRYEIREVFPHKQHPTQKARPFLKPDITVPKAEKRVIKVVEAISVGDLSQRLGVKANELIRKLMGLGTMATVNQMIDIDAAALIAEDYGYEVENIAETEETVLEGGKEIALGDMKVRAPVVTVMGHVDHGKTSLLDAIRETNVVSAEHGGITQHIGAYHVHLDRGDITFLDTPGHEAFTQMRARGAKVTDIVVLVVAADDGVMPQTIEAINHAKAAGVPIIVAINKIDLPQADSKRVRQVLTQYGLLSEEWGGETIFIEVSAKKKLKIKELLEMIILQAEVLELKAAPASPAKGVIIEARLDKNRGPISTVLIQNGTLRQGDVCIAGAYFGRIRAMVSDWGKKIEEAGPSMPVEILGLSGVPHAGDTFIAVKDEATARQIAAIRDRKFSEKEKAKTAKITLIDLYEKIKKGEVKELNVVVKADVQGSIEAIKEVLGKLSTDKVGLKIIHSGTGGINEGDIMLAFASNAIIIGFNVRAEVKAAMLAESEGVDLRLYNIIYNLSDDIKNAMEGMLAPIVREELLGRAAVRDVFKISKTGTIAGSHVSEGKIVRGAKVRLIRDNVVVCEGKISSLKRFKEDVKEVQSGYECGIGIEGYNDIKSGDIIEAYELKEEAAKL